MDSDYLFRKFTQRSALSVNCFWLRDRVFGPQSGDDQDERIQLIAGRAERYGTFSKPQKRRQCESVQHITILY
jgi:hypothetical protein